MPQINIMLNLILMAIYPLMNINTISLICVVICLIPIILFGAIEPPRNSSIEVALSSEVYKLSLIVGISLCGPMIAELLVRVFYVNGFTIKKSIAHQIILLCTLAIPNFLLVCYVIPHKNFTAHLYLMNFQFLLVIWSSLTFLDKKSSFFWRQGKVVLFYSSICLGVTLNVYTVYFINRDYAYLLEVFLIISAIIASLLFISLCLDWIRFIQIENNIKTISTDHYLGNIYVASMIIFVLGKTVILLASGTRLHWYDMQANILAAHMIPFTIFYLTIIVFESKALQRDFTMVKVSIILFT